MHLGQTGSQQDLPIAAVSEMLAVPVPTLRSWERRFDFLTPARSPGGHRRYSSDDLRRLRAVRDEIARGHAVSDAIETVEQTAPRAEHLPFLEAFLAGVEHEDPAAMREALDSARERFGMPEALQRVLLPGMRDVGWRWLSGRCDVGTEHLATDTARAWLTRFRSAPARAGGEGSWIVLACGPRDHHSVGLEAFAAILTEAGWRCHVLGGLTPEGALLRAGSKEGTRALVVVSHLATNRRATVAVLRSVAANIERPLFYAGNAFARTRARRAVPGTYLGEDLLEGAAIIQRAMRGERG